MGSLIAILTALAPVLSQLSGLVTNAIAADATNDQATLDKLHTQALALAEALKPQA
jgi:hypothetical protein